MIWVGYCTGAMLGIRRQYGSSMKQHEAAHSIHTENTLYTHNILHMHICTVMYYVGSIEGQ